MGEKKPEFYWHIYHNVLLSALTAPVEKRVEYIKANKPRHEIETRLRLLKPVRGILPADVIETWKVQVEARRIFDESTAIKSKALQDYASISRTDEKSLEAYREVDVAYEEAWTELHEAAVVCEQTLIDHRDEIHALHVKECPDCPWDGATIFPTEGG